MSQYSPEPWCLAWACSGDTGCTIAKPLIDGVEPDDSGVLTAVDANGKMLEEDPYDGVGGEDWRRIVACVNACRGVPTEALLRVKEKCVVDVYKQTLEMSMDATNLQIRSMIELLRDKGVYCEALTQKPPIANNQGGDS